MNKLGVNIDHVATLRQARGTSYPDPAEAALLAIDGGADQITVHLREDRRHIQDFDLTNLKGMLTVPLNLEMAAVDEIVKIACKIQPHTATLVPERRQELTTEGGLNVTSNPALRTIIEELKRAGIVVSLFIDPNLEDVAASKELGANSVELHTGAYCDSNSDAQRESELTRLEEAALSAREAGLRVAAGHGLNYENTRTVVERIPTIEEYNIGHSIVSRSVFVGFRDAVKEMKSLLEAS